MYGAKAAKDKRDMINKLNKSIDDLQSAPELTPETIAILKEHRETLNSVFKREAQGALIRSRFQYINEVDTCSSFFF